MPIVYVEIKLNIFSVSAGSVIAMRKKNPQAIYVCIYIPAYIYIIYIYVYFSSDHPDCVILFLKTNVMTSE